MTRAALEGFVHDLGLDLVGVAPIERFAGVAPERHPATIFPEAKTVVVIGLEIPRGTFRGIEEGTLWTRAPRQLPPKQTYQVARFLEQDGWEAVPVSPLAPERWPDGVPVAEGKVPPNVSPSLENAAVSAGLGEIGLCGVFLTPQFGPRQSLAMLITDAPLEPGPAHAGTICDGASCAACAAACPLGAIDVKTATVSRRACRLCPNGVFADETSKQAVPNFLTAACVRACIAHLEEAGKLTKRYNSPFRKRKPWAQGLV